jgi:hypothetical protein
LQRQDRIVDAADEHMDYFKTRNETGWIRDSIFKLH